MVFVPLLTYIGQKIWDIPMGLSLRIKTWLKGDLVGTDPQGNRYYRQKNYDGPWTDEPRWVIYNGMQNASKVPSLWHCWLHHTMQFPSANKKFLQPWEKPHLPNLTGTRFAFNPATMPSITRSFMPYKAWRPSSNKTSTEQPTQDS